MESEKKRESGELLGTICGVIAGLIAGGLLVNFIIFPLLSGYTLAEILRLLSR